MTSLVALELSNISSQQVDASVVAAPYYTSHFGRSIQLAIRAIHSIPSLEGASREEVEVYLGRSHPAGLYGRFCAHRDGRGHTGGACLFQLPTEKVPLVEKAGVQILTRLKERKKLCIANAAADSRGPLPSDETSVIYLTWRIVRAHPVYKASARTVARYAWRTGRIVRAHPVYKASIQDVREIASEVYEVLCGAISYETLERGIECVKRPQDKAPMVWY